MTIIKAVTYSIISISLVFVAGGTAALAEAGHEHAASAGQPAASPQIVEDTLHAIQGKQSELAEVVASKKLDDVHHLAFAIRDLAKPLAEKVSTERRAKVEGMINNIARLAEELDASGDAGDQVKTEAYMKKLDSTLKLLEAQVSTK